MKLMLILLLSVFANGILQAQNPSADEAAIRQVIDRLWKGMENGDSAMVHSAFTSEVTFATIYRTKTDGPVIERDNSLTPFLKAVGSPHKDKWFEETWNYKININGDFASVWCDYAFYLGNTFSHCGVDAFHLHHTESGWKIFHLADTRQKLQCIIPEEIQKKHKQP